MDRDDRMIREQEDTERQIQAMPTLAICEHCGEPIRQSTPTLWGDEYVQIADGFIHWENCWNEYGSEHRIQG